MISTKSQTTATTRIQQQTVPCRGDDEIRERLLNKLGIFFGDHTVSSKTGPLSTKSRTGNCHSENRFSPPPADTSRSNRSGDSQPSMVTDSSNASSSPEEGEASVGSSSLIDFSTQTRESLKLEQHLLYQQEKKLQFYPMADVVLIPSHRDYSPQDHDRLWNSSHDIRIQLERNVIEFMKDDGDWRKATEEGSFVAIKGELHHPATFLTVQSERKQKRKHRKQQGQGQGQSPPPAAAASRTVVPPNEERQRKAANVRSAEETTSLVKAPRGSLVAVVVVAEGGL